MFEASSAGLVCVTEQHYLSIISTRLWSVRKFLHFDTQNPEISGLSTAHASYKYKIKRQAKMERGQRQWQVTSLLMYLKAEVCAQTINEWRNQNVMLFYYADKARAGAWSSSVLAKYSVKLIDFAEPQRCTEDRAIRQTLSHYIAVDHFLPSSLFASLLKADLQ